MFVIDQLFLMIAAFLAGVFFCLTICRVAWLPPDDVPDRGPLIPHEW